MLIRKSIFISICIDICSQEGLFKQRKSTWVTSLSYRLFSRLFKNTFFFSWVEEAKKAGEISRRLNLWSKPARAWSIGFELAQIGRRGRATKADFLPLIGIGWKETGTGRLTRGNRKSLMPWEIHWVSKEKASSRYSPQSFPFGQTALVNRIGWAGHIAGDKKWQQGSTEQRDKNSHITICQSSEQSEG